MLVNVIKKLIQSIFSNDWYIGVAALIALIFWILSCKTARKVEQDIIDFRAQKSMSFSKRHNHGLNVQYTVFLTLVSIFPLLGMFGTVTALLGLDLSAGDMDNIKNNFFNALTSTAWGIIFSIFFKFVNAFTSDYIEEQIEEYKKVIDECESGHLMERR